MKNTASVIASNFAKKCEVAQDPWGRIYVHVKNGVKEIPAGAFKDNSRIREVSLPIGLEKIGADAFANCFGLEQINIPSDVAVIGERAFYNCTALDYTYLRPEEGVEVGQCAFAEEVTITCEWNDSYEEWEYRVIA